MTPLAMPMRIHSWLFLLIAVTLSGRPGYADYTVQIDPRTSWGSWEGWGASLCWWAATFGHRDDLADLLFTTDETSLNGTVLPGLGLNIVRYNAGASSDAPNGGDAMQVSPNMIPSRQMEGYWINGGSEDPASSSWDWSRDANQRAMLLKARDRGANRFELFSNSPMWWMLQNHNPSGADNGADDNLRPEFYRQHAVYMASIADHARDHWGIAFDTVEPFNEPHASWWDANGTQEGCHFDHGTQETVIGLLRDEMDARGLESTGIAASDETSSDAARDTWQAFSSATRAKVDRVNVHGYQYEGGRRDLLYDAVSADGKRLWNSEYGESDATGVRLAKNLNYDFRWLRNTAWCYWQPLDWAGWGLIDANLETQWIGQPHRKYYVLAHYTRHIRPGMIILDGFQPDTVAAYDPAGRKLVLVTMNYDTPQTITHDLSMFVRADGPVRRWVTETGSSVSYARFDDTTLSGKTFQSAFAANTIQTFEIRNVDAWPDLRVEAIGGGEIRLSWPAETTGYELMASETPAPSGAWQPVAGDPTVVGGDFQQVLPANGAPRRFFRLSPQ